MTGTGRRRRDRASTSSRSAAACRNARPIGAALERDRVLGDLARRHGRGLRRPGADPAFNPVSRASAAGGSSTSLAARRRAGMVVIAAPSTPAAWPGGQDTTDWIVGSGGSRHAGRRRQLRHLRRRTRPPAAGPVADVAGARVRRHDLGIAAPRTKSGKGRPLHRPGDAGALEQLAATAVAAPGLPATSAVPSWSPSSRPRHRTKGTFAPFSWRGGSALPTPSLSG